MSHSTLYIGSTTVLELDGLATGDADGNVEAYQNNATVVLLALVDKRTGDPVSGVTVPMALAYVADSDGKYQGTIPGDAGITAGRVYLATVKAVSAAGQVAEWNETLIAEVRAG
ncbi:MAG TPA: hypothetical protein VF329_03515 [Gammaproteobacteria bacterium]